MPKGAAECMKGRDSKHQLLSDFQESNTKVVADTKTKPWNQMVNLGMQENVDDQHTRNLNSSIERSRYVYQARESHAATLDNDGDSVSEIDPTGGLPYSDIDESSTVDRLDLIPHQRLTVNNTTALLSAHSTLVQVSASHNHFSDSQAVTSSLPTADSISNVEDDFTRELALYKQCLDAAIQARVLLREEDVAFSRPNDFFAEMVKSDDHMGKIKRKILEEAAAKKASADAKRQRDLKKFGKQVQIAKGQERDRARKSTLEKIETLKRKRREGNGPIANTDENDPFDVALEEAGKSSTRKNPWGSAGSSRTASSKRHKKDVKFGFGGKKRFSKSGDTLSSGDIRDYPPQKVKVTKGPKRLGKSRRTSQTRL